MKKVCNILLAVLFSGLLLGVPLATKLEKNEEISVFENRVLAAVPVFSSEALLNGGYFRDWETYFSDHIVLRETMLRAYVGLGLSLPGRVTVNDVVVRPEVLLPFHPFGSFDPGKTNEAISSMTEELSGLRAFVEERGGAFYYLGVPGQFSMLRAHYPACLDDGCRELDYVEERFFPALAEKGVSALDMRERFLRDGDYETLYSAVDHHFNYLGAYRSYLALMEEIVRGGGYDLPVLGPSDLELVSLDKPFYGSRSRRLFGAYQSDERLILGYPKQPVPFTRTNNGNPVDSSVYALPDEAAAYADYTVYMGGDIAETVISTGRPDLPDLLVFGDSFTNALETLLYYSFDETRTLDLRHYGKMTLYDYIEQYRPDVVVCVRDDSSYLLETGNGSFR